MQSESGCAARHAPDGRSRDRGHAANLYVNLAILIPVGTFTALGEELGWREEPPWATLARSARPIM
jgi:hypothetical protein